MSQYVGLIFPIQIVPSPYFNVITDIYGFREWRVKAYGQQNSFHTGVDIGTPIGVSVRTPYDGTVTEVFNNISGAGNILKIKHDEGFETRYLHLDSFSVKKGQKVFAGDVVARTGNTDGSTTISTGPHLHFEVIVNGKTVDPTPYLYGYVYEDKGGKFVPNKKTAFKRIPITLPTELKGKLTEQQLQNAKIIVDKCKELGGSKRDAIIGIVVALKESQLLGLNYVTGAVGVFQHKIIQGWGTEAQLKDVSYDATVFYSGIGSNKGALSFQERNTLSISKACQKIQLQANPQATDELYIAQEPLATQIVNFLWEAVINSSLDQFKTEIQQNTREEIRVDDYLASGIWQIIKVVIDPEVAQKQINDATVSMMQGSLFSFFEKVCQKPFVEFWGDTYGDQYYFIIRKPPFTETSFKSLVTIDVLERDVYQDSLGWENDQIYSWYQLIPNGNYIGAEELIFQYIPAVYFPEYGEIWGSRPLSITTNYITFIKETGKIQIQAAIQDLKFLTDIHSYLPFTRKGTITIRGDRRIKRGMRIYYQPTNEYFYVESVSQSFTVNDGVLDRVTQLTVSHGMIKEHVDIKIEDQNTPSYFNLINYGQKYNNGTPKNDDLTAIPKDMNLNIERHVAYFNIDKYTFSYDDVNEATGLYVNSGNIFFGVDSYKNGTEELKVTKAIVDSNFQNCKNVAELLSKYRGLKLEIVGNTDSFDSDQYNIILGENRAKTIRALIIKFYKDLNPTSTPKELLELEQRLKIRTDGENSPTDDNRTPIGRLKNRRVDIYREGELDQIKQSSENQQPQELKPPKEGNWHVNKKVFMFFLRRKQFLRVYAEN